MNWTASLPLRDVHPWVDLSTPAPLTSLHRVDLGRVDHSDYNSEYVSYGRRVGHSVFECLHPLALRGSPTAITGVGGLFFGVWLGNGGYFFPVVRSPRKRSIGSRGAFYTEALHTPCCHHASHFYFGGDEAVSFFGLGGKGTEPIPLL